jgi:hypothetical protein
LAFGPVSPFFLKKTMEKKKNMEWVAVQEDPMDDMLLTCLQPSLDRDQQHLFRGLRHVVCQKERHTLLTKAPSQTIDGAMPHFLAILLHELMLASVAFQAVV